MSPTIEISGVWIRRKLKTVQLLVEVSGEWRLVAEEQIDGEFSHIVEPGGIRNSPPDEDTSNA